MSLKVTNTNLNGIHLIEIPGFDDEDVVCSRLKRGELVIVPKADTDVQLGDILHLVGNPESLKKMHLHTLYKLLTGEVRFSTTEAAA